MIKLDFSNVEELIFVNEKVRHVLPPSFFNYFESWALGKRVPVLKQVGRQAMYDLLNALNEDHVLRLEEFFGERIIIEKLNYNAVKNIKLSLDDTEMCKILCNIVGDNYYSVCRDDRYIFITFWR
jgi:hypothetical protein